jgi:hypothetical protein
MSSLKQKPVIEKLRFLMEESMAVAAAIRDNAMDDGEPIDAHDLLDLISDYQTVLELLDEAFNVTSGTEQPPQNSGACSIG